MTDATPNFLFSCLLQGPQRGARLDMDAIRAWAPADGPLWLHVGGLPGLDSPQGFTVSVTVMGIAGVLLLVLFRWKKWL